MDPAAFRQRQEAKDPDPNVDVKEVPFVACGVVQAQ
jgi:hypothetical protein